MFFDVGEGRCPTDVSFFFQADDTFMTMWGMLSEAKYLSAWNDVTDALFC